MKELFIIRGVSGSGKSSFADRLGGLVLENDQFFFDDNGNYSYDRSKLNHANAKCIEDMVSAMTRNESRIVIVGSLTTEEELQPYLNWATEYDYRVHVATVENWTGKTSTHNVSEDELAKQEEEYTIAL